MVYSQCTSRLVRDHLRAFIVLQHQRDNAGHQSNRGTWGSVGKGGRTASGSRSGPNTFNMGSTSTTTDHGWGSINKQTQAETSWGSSKASTDQPGPSRRSSGLADPWSSSSNKATSGKPDNDLDNEWGPTNCWGSDTDNDKGGKGKGKAEVSGWDKAADATTQSSGGWGNTSGGWSTDTNKEGGGGGWGRNSEGWGSSDKDVTSLGKTDATGSSGWDNASGPTMTASSPGWAGAPGKSTYGWTDSSKDAANSGVGNGWTTGASDWDTRPKPPATRPPPIPQPNSPATDTHKGGHAPTLHSTMPPPPIPLPGRKLSSSTSAAQPITKSSALKSSLKIKTVEIEPSESASSAASARPRDAPWTRTRIQTNTIRYSLQAVRFQLELNNARADIERWKRLRGSPQFTRATPMTQTVIADQRAAYGHAERDIETKLQSTIKYLSELPEITTRADLLAAEASEKDLVEYTAQLRDWIACVKALYPAEPPPEPETDLSPKEAERSKHPKELIWDRIETFVESVTEQHDFISDTLYDTRAPVDALSGFVTKREAFDAKQLSEAQGKAQDMLLEANQIGDEVKVVAEETAKMVASIHMNGQVLQNLEAELRVSEQANDQLAGYVAQLEEWKKADATSIQRLTERVKSLHTATRPTPTPLNPDDLTSLAGAVVLDRLQAELTRFATGIRAASAENSRICAKEIYKQLEPILKVTNDVCRRADAITARRLQVT
ncbi:hypothetical protein DXG01_009917 [Tephrocybe rancida]|nr:hypothetical protein DXG01_009917 [Tephrocybe rancida]